MTRLLLSLLLFSLILHARENPFAPPATVGNMPLQAPIPTPDLDRELVPVINQAQCVAAPKAPETNKRETPKKVWKHFPPEQNATAKPPVKTPLVAQKRKTVHKRHKVHRPKKRHVRHYRLVYRNDNLKIYLKPHRIRIVTSDCLQKHFRLRNPHRLVLDFGDDFVIYDTVSKPLHTGVFKRLKIGTHACFYRVTFVLAAARHYRVHRKPYGYLITLF